LSLAAAMTDVRSHVTICLENFIYPVEKNYDWDTVMKRIRLDDFPDKPEDCEDVGLLNRLELSGLAAWDAAKHVGSDSLTSSQRCLLYVKWREKQDHDHDEHVEKKEIEGGNHRTHRNRAWTTWWRNISWKLSPTRRKNRAVMAIFFAFVCFVSLR